jgi:hypothetical protein
MVSLRSGKSVKGTTSKSKKAESSQKTKPQPKANISKKRKAEVAVPEDEDKENKARPSTPTSKSKVSAPAPPLGDSELANMPGYERTPGRVGPIKEERFDVSPDIKPFKGPPGKKVRKTAYV